MTVLSSRHCGKCFYAVEGSTKEKPKKTWNIIKNNCIVTPRVQTSANDEKFNQRHPDYMINPNPDVCQICPKMLWMNYLVGVRHFAKYSTNRPLCVWEMVKW